MGLYRVKSGKYWIGHEPYRAGDLVELPEEQAEKFSDVLEPAGSDPAGGETKAGRLVEPEPEAEEKPETEEPKAGPAATKPQEPPEPPKPKAPKRASLDELHWAEATKVIRESGSARDVKAWLEEEKQGKERNSILEAAENRLAELED